MDLLVYYAIIVVAFIGGFVTCAILAFGRQRDEAFDVEEDEHERA